MKTNQFVLNDLEITLEAINAVREEILSKTSLDTNKDYNRLMALYGALGSQTSEYLKALKSVSKRVA